MGYLELETDASGRAIGRIVNFLKHQRVDKPQPSKIKPSKGFVESSTNNRRTLDDGMEWKGKGNGREQRKGIPPNPPRGGAEDPVSKGASAAVTLSDGRYGRALAATQETIYRVPAKANFPADVISSRSSHITAAQLQQYLLRGAAGERGFADRFAAGRGSEAAAGNAGSGLGRVGADDLETFLREGDPGYGSVPSTPEFDTRRLGLRAQSDDRLRAAWRSAFNFGIFVGIGRFTGAPQPLMEAIVDAAIANKFADCHPAKIAA